MSERPSGTHLEPILMAVAAMVDDLQRILGPKSEVLVHDLSQPQQSVIAIAGTLTGRKIGAPATDLLLRLLRHGNTDSNPINYETRSADGKVLRSSTIFLRGADQEVVGALCINIDVSGGAEVREWLISHIGALMAPSAEVSVEEHFGGTIEDVVEKAVKAALEGVASAPENLSKQERLRIIDALDQQGVFLVKRSSSAVAAALKVSRATLYNDLNQVRGMMDVESP